MATATQIKQFIERLGGLAVLESKRRIIAGKGFVLPSVCIAQSAIETGWGTAGIMTRANAYFGIKAGGSWTGAVYRADTWEVANGEAYNTTANFRAYSSLEASVADYYDLIGNNSRYSNALSFGEDVSKWKSARECITAIWSGGYATDTLYVEKIMNTINARDLIKYDALIMSVSVDELNVSNLPALSILYKKEDFTQGALRAIDSGRTIEIDRTVNYAVSIDWEKATTVTSDTTYSVTGVPENHLLYFAELIGDTATISAGQREWSAKLIRKDTKFAIMISNSEGSKLSVDDLPDSLEIKLSSGFYPDSDERFTTGIAYFVKI